MAKKDSEQQKKSMSRLFRGKAIFKPLNTGRIDERVACVREWVANIFFYTKNGVTVMIDAGYNYGRLKEKMGCLDWLLLTKPHFFQRFYPETEGCEGYHQFGFNRKEQLTRIILFPFVAALMAGIACLIGGRI